MPCFNTCIKLDNINYNVTIAVDSPEPPQNCNLINASSDWDFFGEVESYEYVVYNMNDKLVDIEIDDATIKREIELYFETNSMYVNRMY